MQHINDMSHVITIAQQKGGSGKTTVAANIAISAVQAGYSVAVIDSDPQGSLGRWFMARYEAMGGEADLKFATASAWGISFEVDQLKKGVALYERFIDHVCVQGND